MTERAAQPELPPEPAKHDEIRPAPSDAATSSPVPSSPVPSSPVPSSPVPSSPVPSSPVPSSPVPSSPVPSSVAPSSPAPSHALPAVPEGKLPVPHRVVMPAERDFVVLKLYVDGNAVFGRRTSDLKSAAERVLAEQDGDSAGATAPFRPASKDDSAEIIGRRSIVVPSGARVSFCSYFNAFPAGYWRRWSTIENV